LNGPGALFLAFGAGIVSFLSPCILPLLPGYLSYISGLGAAEVQSQQNSRLVVVGALLFVLGFSLVLVALGATMSYLGSIIAPNRDILTRVAGAFIILLALVPVVGFLVMLGCLLVIERNVRKLGKAGLAPRWRHLAHSAGTLGYPPARPDLTRGAAAMLGGMRESVDYIGDVEGRDINRGKADVVVGAIGIAVLGGNGDGTLRAPVVSAASLGDVGDIAIGDLNNDGKPDVACLVVVEAGRAGIEAIYD